MDAPFEVVNRHRGRLGTKHRVESIADTGRRTSVSNPPISLSAEQRESSGSVVFRRVCDRPLGSNTNVTGPRGLGFSEYALGEVGCEWHAEAHSLVGLHHEQDPKDQ